MSFYPLQPSAPKLDAKELLSAAENLKIVLLKCPYANWFDERVPKMFGEMVALKLNGYQKKHFFGVMPIDGTDFVTDHILVCLERKSGELIPLLGSKSLPYDICQRFHLDFTIEAFFKKGQNLSHLKLLQNILEDVSAQGRRISYFSSWTTLPDAQRNEILNSKLKELYAASTLLHHREQGITDLFGLGLPKFKTDEFFFNWGFERVLDQGTPTPNLPLPSFGGIDAVFMHLKKYSDYAERAAEKNLKLWENKLSIGSTIFEYERTGGSAEIKKAAA